MSQSLAECKSRLSSIQSYRRHLTKVSKAIVTSSKTLDLRFNGPVGFEAKTVVSTLNAGSPDEVAFESWGGNIDLVGLVDFEEVRPDFTEVTIAVHYEIKNKFYAWLDRKLGFMDAILIAELRSLRSHFEGVAAPVSEEMPMFTMLEPVSA